MKKSLKIIFCLSVLTLFFTTGIFAQVASGGSYTLNKAVVANGGGNSSGGNYAVQGTAGQSVAGTNMYSANYVAFSGFWGNVLAPTAASANISGRVINAEGTGINNISVVLAGAPLTAPRIVKTNSFGNFTFENLEVGQTYVISVSNKKYGFGQESQVISLLENVSDIVFQSTWEN